MCCITGQGQLPLKHEGRSGELNKRTAAALSVCEFLYIAAVAKEQLSYPLKSLAGLRVFLIFITAGRGRSSQALAGAAASQVS